MHNFIDIRQVEEANEQAIQYTAQLASEIDTELYQSDEIKKALEEKGFIFQSIQVGAQSLGKWTGKVAGASIGAAPGAALGNPPAAIGGVYIGQKVGGKYGEFLGNYATEKAYYYLHTKPLEGKLDAVKEKLQDKYENELHNIQQELKKSGKNPAYQEYVMRQMHQNFQFQPHFNLLNDKQQQALRTKINNYDQTLQVDQTSKLTKIIQLQDQIAGEVKKFHGDLINTVEAQTVIASETFDAVKSTQYLLNAWGHNLEDLGKDTNVKVRSILYRLHEHTTILRRLNQDLAKRQEKEIKQARLNAFMADVRGVTDAFSALSEMDSKVLKQIGFYGQAGTKLAYNCALISGAIPGAAVPTGLALLSPVSVIAITLVSLLGNLFHRKKKQDGLGEALVALSRQIRDLHQEMRMSFQIIDQKLDRITAILVSGFTQLTALFEFRFGSFAENTTAALTNLQTDLDRFIQLFQVNSEKLFLQNFNQACYELMDPGIITLGDLEIRKRLVTLRSGIKDGCHESILNGYNFLHGHDHGNSANWLTKVLKMHPSEYYANLLGYFAGIVVSGRLTGTDNFEFTPTMMPNVLVFRTGVQHYINAILNFNDSIPDDLKTELVMLCDSANNGIAFIKHLQQNRFILFAKLKEQIDLATKTYYQMFSQELIKAWQNSTVAPNTVNFTEILKTPERVILNLPNDFKGVTLQKIITDAGAKGFVLLDLIRRALSLGLGNIVINCSVNRTLIPSMPFVGRPTPLLSNNFNYTFNISYQNGTTLMSLGVLTYQTTVADVIQHYGSLLAIPINVRTERNLQNIYAYAWACSKGTAAPSNIANLAPTAKTLIPQIIETLPRDSKLFTEIANDVTAKKPVNLKECLDVIKSLISLLKAFAEVIGLNQEQLMMIMDVEKLSHEAELINAIKDSKKLIPILAFPSTLTIKNSEEDPVLNSPLLSMLQDSEEMLLGLENIQKALSLLKLATQESSEKKTDETIKKQLKKANKKYEKGKEHFNSGKDDYFSFFKKAKEGYEEILEISELSDRKKEKFEKRIRKITEGKYKQLKV